ncbi:Glycosyltransferase involved in cell wall bisynthesis [Marinobacter gudaonensis]|uniref:Glycosyltransferase involved in cell wall bisynthesis n=1 Tax=Marinobacter gudaonensis TaxID=375760 RepID=A0A1I6GDT3_9GAMM|nr:glycosyltransferase [Marinobacter gudaonensis]SFR40281.1 Glycosyltransferase involved in cell wall bisynthesis [Marinobacter gudaonensis]
MFDKEVVLFVMDQFVNPYAGTESQLFKLISHLPAEGITPRLLVLRSSPFVENGEMPCPVDVLGHASLRDPRTWLSFWRYARRARKNGIKVAHVFFNDASVVAPPLFRSTGIRTIISRRDMGYWYTPLYLKLLRQTGRFVDQVVVNSEAVRQVTHDKEGIALDRIQVIYNGYVPKSRDDLPKVAELERLRETIGEAPMAMLVANLRPIKRISDALEALRVLKEQGVFLHLVILGGGDQKVLKETAQKLGVSGQVHFLGRRNDVDACLAYGHVGILCSESEGYSNAIVEYMEAGLPVIASNVGGNREAVVHGNTGWLYSIGDFGELADFLGRVCGEPEVAKEMGRRGRMLAGERHNLHKMVESHLELYDRLSTLGRGHFSFSSKDV